MSETSAQNDIPETQVVAGLFARFGEEGYTFSPTTNRIEKWALEHAWLIGILLLLAIALVTSASIPLSGEGKAILDRLANRNADLSGDALLAYFDARDFFTYTAPFMLAIIVPGLFLTRFLRTSPRSLFELAQAGRLVPKKADANNGTLVPRSWQTYVDDFEKALLNPRRSFLMAVMMVIAYALSLVIAYQRHMNTVSSSVGKGFINSGFWPVVLIELLTLLLGPAIIGYLASLGIWNVYIVGLYIRSLTSVFELDVQPHHGDQCGGLRRIGDLCLQIALIVILPSVVFGVWYLTGVLSHTISGVSALVSVGSAMIAIMATVAFFHPLWSIHKEMVRVKTEMEDEAVRRIAPIEAQLRKALGDETNSDTNVKLLEERLEKLRKLYPPDLKYPDWPFSTPILLGFFSAQIVPIITVISSILDAGDVIKKLGL